ncbi:hypothetical protein IMCC1989_2500 [gamma proteobacterium IMCC1989]|nr:hypothetical protein IMCC1989_2500 [gamma proteobacterium IMCC1989]
MFVGSHTNIRKFECFTKQKGVVLIVALVMLLIMTVAGVTTMTGATLQERIAGNQRQQMIARGNADRVLKEAEAILDTLDDNSSFNLAITHAQFAPANDGLYMAVSLDSGMAAQPLDPLFDRSNLTDWNNSPNNSAASVNGGGRYIIEYMGAENFEEYNFDSGPSYDNSDIGSGDGGLNSNRKVFRITAMGVGNDGNVATILESYYLEAAKI